VREGLREELTNLVNAQGPYINAVQNQVDPARRVTAGEALKHPFFDEQEGGSANGI
jgi:hypothetical protein